MNPIELTINKTFVPYKKNEVHLQKLKILTSDSKQTNLSQNKNSYRLYELEKKIADVQSKLSKEQIRESILNKYIKYKTLEQEEVELIEELNENPPQSIEKILEIVNSNKKILNNIIEKLKIEYENIFSVYSLSQVDDISNRISYIESSKNFSYHNINVKRAKNLLTS